MISFGFVKRLSKILLLLLLFRVEAYASNIWEIHTVDGANLACTELIDISNDSLHTEILGVRKSFAIEDIIRISRYRRNVNNMMVIGGVVGGTAGFLVDNFIKGDEIDIRNNGVFFTIAGLISGTFCGHFLSINNSIDLSQMDIIEKKEIIKSMIAID